MASKRKKAARSAPRKAKTRAKARAAKSTRAKSRAKSRTAKRSARARRVTRAEIENKLRGLNGQWSARVPAEVQSAGAMDVPADHPLRDLAGVPNGRYRVDGSDWIFHVAGGALIMVERGRPDTDPGSYETIPAEPVPGEE